MQAKNNLLKFFPFWLFLLFFKIGAGLHYTLSSPLGEQLFPLWLVGIIVACATAIQVFLDVPAGYVLDKYGYLRCLKIGATIFLIATTCFWFGLTPVTYLLSFFLASVGWLFFGPGVNAYILSHAPKTHAGKFVAFRDVFSALGSISACALLAMVLLLPVQKVGLFLSLFILIALIALIFSPTDHTSVHKEQKLETQHHYIRRHYLGTLLKTIAKLNPASTLLLLVGLSGSIFYAIVWFVVPLIIAQKYEGSFFGIGLGVFDLATVLFGFLLGHIADKANKRIMMFVGLLIFTIASLLLGFQLGWMFLFFGFLASTGDAIAGISLWSWLFTLDKNHAHDGAVSGVLFLFQDLGWVIGPVMAGILYPILGAPNTIALGAIPILVTFILAHFLAPKNPCANLPVGTVPHKPLRCPHKT